MKDVVVSGLQLWVIGLTSPGDCERLKRALLRIVGGSRKLAYLATVVDCYLIDAMNFLSLCPCCCQQIRSLCYPDRRVGGN